jgi:chromosome segregation ATPase
MPEETIDQLRNHREQLKAENDRLNPENDALKQQMGTLTRALADANGVRDQALADLETLRPVAAQVGDLQAANLKLAAQHSAMVKALAGAVKPIFDLLQTVREQIL